jgi:hypothetical protein
VVGGGGCILLDVLGLLFLFSHLIDLLIIDILLGENLG